MSIFLEAMTTQDDFSEETIEKHDIECLMDLPGCTANQKDPKVSQPGSVSTSPRSSINEEKGSTDESAAEIDLRFRRKFSRVSKLVFVIPTFSHGLSN